MRAKTVATKRRRIRFRSCVVGSFAFSWQSIYNSQSPVRIGAWWLVTLLFLFLLHTEFPLYTPRSFPHFLGKISSSVMHRTSSTTRISDEFFNSSTSQSATVDSDQLPTYNPLSHVAKKERMRIRSAENAVHLIPVILILCVIILWFFSYPGQFLKSLMCFTLRLEELFCVCFSLRLILWIEVCWPIEKLLVLWIVRSRLVTNFENYSWILFLETIWTLFVFFLCFPPLDFHRIYNRNNIVFLLFVCFLFKGNLEFFVWFYLLYRFRPKNTIRSQFYLHCLVLSLSVQVHIHEELEVTAWREEKNDKIENKNKRTIQT